MTHHLIHDAADKGDLDALRRELALGVSPNAIHHGRTPLYYLLFSRGRYGDIPDDRVDCLNALLEAGADINANLTAATPPPLHWAAAHGHVKLVVAFRSLPPEMVRLVVEYAFHVGYY